MADKKKVYSITINGIKESVELIKSLNEQMKSLDELIKKVDGSKITVSGEMDFKEGEKTVVSGGKEKSDVSQSTKEERLEAEKLLAVKKQISAEEKAEAKLAAMTTEEFRQSYQAQAQTKEQIKQAKAELDAMASGAAKLTDEGVEYANTMKGMKAELKALKAERDNLDLAKPEDVERFKEIQQRALELETLLKSIESEAGVFSRNVGNYPQLLKQTTAEFENIQKVIDSLNAKLAATAPGTEGYDKLKTELQQAEKYAKTLDDRLKDINSNLSEISRTGFNVNIGGVEREFTSIKDAVKTLTKELQVMTTEGKTNTKEFEDTIQALGKLKTAIKNTSNEIQSYVGNSKGLNDTIEIMKGVTGIAAIGTGISQLFGGVNEDLDESIKKFTALTLILQGIQNLQQQMKDETNKFGQVLSYVFETIKTGIRGIPKIGEGIEKAAQWAEKWRDRMKEAVAFESLEKKLDKAYSEFDKLISQQKTLKENFMSMSETAQEMVRGVSQLSQSEINLAKNEGYIDDDDVEALQDYLTELEKVKAANPAFKKSIETVNDSINDTSAKLSTAEVHLKKLPGWLQKAATGTGFWAMACRGLTTAILSAVAALEALAAATVILLVIQGAMWVIDKIIDGVSTLFSTMKGASELDFDEKMSMIEKNTELANKQLERYINNIKLIKDLGLISELEAQGLAFLKIDEEIRKAGEDLQKFIEYQDEIDLKTLRGTLNSSHIWGDASNIPYTEDLAEFKKEYDILIRAVEQGLDKIEAGSERGWGWLLTSDDAVEELGDKTKAVLGDMAVEIYQINFDHPEEAVKKFRKIMDDELYNSALTQMHTLFPEEEWAKALDRMYNRLSTMVEMSEKRAQDLAVAMKKANEDLEDQAELSRINAIADEKKRADALDAYNKKKRQKEINESLADEQHKKEALDALDAEYEQKKRDRDKKNAKDSKKLSDEQYNIMKQIRANLLELEADGLDKQLKQLENAMEDELHAAEKAGKLRGELILSIQQKYQKKIQDARTEWFKNLKKQTEKWQKEMIDFLTQSADELGNIIKSSTLNDITREMEINDIENVRKASNISYDNSIDTSDMTDEQNERNLRNQQRYYEELLDEQRRYILKKQELQEQEIRETEKQNTENALREYNNRMRTNSEWYESQIEQQDEFRKKGIVTEEEYQQNITRISDAYQEANLNAWNTYQENLIEITKQAEHDITKAVEDGRKEQQKVNDDANKKSLDSYQEYLENIKKISEREQELNTNGFTGLFDYSKEKKRLKGVMEEYKNTFNELESEMTELQQQYETGQIDFSQFDEAKKKIEQLRQEVIALMRVTGTQLDKLAETWASRLNDFVSDVAQQFSTVFSIFENIQELRLEAEEQALDKEQKILDRQSAMIEKAYSKQADIVQKYRDAINDTEDELKDARGERRLALLDNLAQQKEGYNNEVAALKQQELEKEKIARKEDDLKKKQDALEKKRKQQQQQASLVNATINVALGVTQALSAYPPPISQILAATIGALGATQIALIASQKYAKGGRLEGPDHNHGGITLGFTADGVRQEAQGGEYITNRETTNYNMPLLSFINMKKKRLTLDDFVEFYSNGKHKISSSSLGKFENGGQLPQISDLQTYAEQHPIVVDLSIDSKVSTVDIVSAIDRLTETKILAGL